MRAAPGAVRSKSSAHLAGGARANASKSLECWSAAFAAAMVMQYVSYEQAQPSDHNHDQALAGVKINTELTVYRHTWTGKALPKVGSLLAVWFKLSCYQHKLLAMQDISCLCLV